MNPNTLSLDEAAELSICMQSHMHHCVKLVRDAENLDRLDPSGVTSVALRAHLNQALINARAVHEALRNLASDADDV